MTAQAVPPQHPQPVDEALGYDSAYVEQVGTLPLAARLLRNHADTQLWQIGFGLFAVLLGLQILIHYLSGALAYGPAGDSIGGWIAYFQFDLLHAFLITYLLIGSEGFRRGFACHVRRLTPWLSADAPYSEDVLAKRPGYVWLAGVIAVVFFVPIMSIPVYDNFPVTTIFYLMIVRMTILYWLIGTRIPEFILLSQRLAALVRQHLTYRLIEDEPRRIIGGQTLTSSLFLMIGVGVTIPTLSDTPTIMQTIGLLVLLTLISVLILLWPIFALRNKIRDTKSAEMDMLQPRLNDCWDALRRGEDPPHDLPALVAWRQEIRNTPDWVFDGESAVRLLIILLVPAGSLIAGEFAESLLERLIGG
ncbi:MAG: hypothetical protein ABF335_12575 [Alphaproteobacteria bacterium]